MGEYLLNTLNGSKQSQGLLSLTISTIVPVIPSQLKKYLHGHSDEGARLLSQRGDSPFVYRDGAGWPASLPYIRKICVSVAIGTQSGIYLTKGYLR